MFVIPFIIPSASKHFDNDGGYVKVAESHEYDKEFQNSKISNMWPHRIEFLQILW